MKKTILLLAIGFLLMFSACTENQQARNFGGTETVAIAPGRKVVTVTWKSHETSADLWILTRAAKEGEKPESLEFAEKSTYGVFEGKVILKEQ